MRFSSSNSDEIGPRNEIWIGNLNSVDSDEDPNLAVGLSCSDDFDLIIVSRALGGSVASSCDTPGPKTIN